MPTGRRGRGGGGRIARLGRGRGTGGSRVASPPAVVNTGEADDGSCACGLCSLQAGDEAVGCED